MLKKPEQPSFDHIVQNLREYKFDVAPAAGVANPAAKPMKVSKYGCSAVIESAGKGAVPRMTAKPGILVNGEIGHILDKGYQKFIKTRSAERPATAEQLKSLHRFSEELKMVTHAVSLYNEGLGSVTSEYVYDRVKGRNLPESERPRPAWEQPVEVK